MGGNSPAPVRIIPTGAVSPLIGAIGSSSVSRSRLVGSGEDQWTASSWFPWMATLCPQVRIEPATTQGFFGLFSSDMLATGLPAILAANPRPAACILQLTNNDPSSGVPYATTKANYLAMARALVGAGIVPILVLPHPTNTLNGTATALQTHLQAAEFFRRLPMIVPGCVLVDIAAVTQDRSQSGFVPIASYMESDATHLNPLGSFAAALQLKAAVDRLFPATVTAALTDADVYTANNPLGSLFANPILIGTGGTGGSGSNIATGYAYANGISGLTVTPSKFFDTRPWQRLVFSGSAAAAGFVTLDGSLVSGALASLVPGDRIQMSLEYRVSGNMAGFGAVAARMTPTGTGFTSTNFRAGVMGSTGVSTAHSGVLRTAIFTVPTGASVNNLFARMNYSNAANVAHDFTLDIGEMQIRRLPTEYP